LIAASAARQSVPHLRDLVGREGAQRQQQVDVGRRPKLAFGRAPEHHRGHEVGGQGVAGSRQEYGQGGRDVAW
jgi:hypothetical protein